MTRSQQSDLDFGNITTGINVKDPVNAGDIANKRYVDNALEGLAWKDNAAVRTQSNVNLAAPGASVDGVAMAGSVNKRVVVSAQTVPAENGIYVWSGAASPMVRSDDADTAQSLASAVVSIEQGTNAGQTYRQTNLISTLGTDAVSWAQFVAGAAAASETASGTAELATQGEADTATDDLRIMTPLKVKQASYRVRRREFIFGDGTATQIDLAHNIGSRGVVASVMRNSGNYDDIGCDQSRPDVNTLRLNFAVAPAANSLRAVVIGSQTE